jgi:hypothetical protein
MHNKYTGVYKDSVIGYNDYYITIDTDEIEVFNKFNEMMIEFQSWSKQRRRSLP